MNINNKTNPMLLSYVDRIRGYERDKKKLLEQEAALPADQFEKRLKILQKKWRI